jgi:hypothetical protein
MAKRMGFRATGPVRADAAKVACVRCGRMALPGLQLRWDENDNPVCAPRAAQACAERAARKGAA